MANKSKPSALKTAPESESCGNGGSELPATQDSEKEAELERLATEELLRETEKAKTRAESGGALAWGLKRKFIPNRRFLQNTLVATVTGNIRSNTVISRAQNPSKKLRTKSPSSVRNVAS